MFFMWKSVKTALYFDNFKNNIAIYYTLKIFYNLFKVFKF